MAGGAALEAEDGAGTEARGTEGSGWFPTTKLVLYRKSGRLRDSAVLYDHNCIALQLWQAT